MLPSALPARSAPSGVSSGPPSLAASSGVTAAMRLPEPSAIVSQKTNVRHMRITR
jgi:hypothetical protein